MRRKSNKKPILVTTLVVLFVILITHYLTYRYGYNSGESHLNKSMSIIFEEKNNQLEAREGAVLKKEVEVNTAYTNLNQTLAELDNCKVNLINNQTELNQCINSTGVFPLFWTFNIYLTNGWIEAINIYISLTIALFSLKIIIKIFFQRKNVRK